MRSKMLVGLLLVAFILFLASFVHSEKVLRLPAKTPINHLNKGDCKQTPTYPDPDNIIITVSGNNITVLHADAFYNCCFQITTEVVQTDSVINLYEHTSGEPCFCMCYFDLTTTIYNLDPGTYTINVYNADGEYVGGGTATIEKKGKRIYRRRLE